MMHGLNVDKIQKLLDALNMNGINLTKTKVGIDLRQKRMTRIRNDAQTEIISMKTDIENEMLTAVLATEGDKVFSFDGHYSNRANSAQACLCTMMSELDGKSVCVGSCVIKRKQNISEAAAKSAPGILCDLAAKKMEAYGLELLTKMIALRTDEQFYLCSAKGFKILMFFFNVFLIFVSNIRHQHRYSPIFVSNIRHQHRYSLIFVSNLRN